MTWSVSCIYFWKVPQNIWFEKSPKEDWSSRNNRSFQPWMLRKWSKNYMEWWSRLKIFPWIFGKSFFIKDWTHQSENMAFQRLLFLPLGHLPSALIFKISKSKFWYISIIGNIFSETYKIFVHYTKISTVALNLTKAEDMLQC